MKYRGLWFFLAIAAAAVVLGALVMAWQGSFLRENIVRPLSYAFWMTGIMIRGTPQALFWGILVLIVFVMALRSLFGRSRNRPRAQIVPDNIYHRSRLRYWLHQLQLTRYESARFQLHDSIARLSMDVLSYQQGMTMQQYMRQVDPDTIQPDFLAFYFQSRSQPVPRPTSWDLNELRRVLSRFWEALPIHKEQGGRQDPNIERVVAYLEEQMDVE